MDQFNSWQNSLRCRNDLNPAITFRLLLQLIYPVLTWLFYAAALGI
ncbi:hypothetical protein [uncultured Cedecea sp.]|nr:hypothetical protein [uncultured Cedecea sp.]